MSTGANLKAYNSLWQLRNDTWPSLGESATQLARAEGQQGPVEKLVEKVTELLDVLGPIERFWAFPGAQAYREAPRLFAADKYDLLCPRGDQSHPGPCHRVLPPRPRLGPRRRGRYIRSRGPSGGAGPDGPSVFRGSRRRGH